MKNYNQSPLIITVCYSLLVLAGAVHIACTRSSTAVGAYFIQLGSYLRQHTFNDQQLYLDNLPFGSFTITIGIFMILASFGLRIVLNSRFGSTGQLIVWITHWLICIFNFAVAFLEIRQYVFQQQSFYKFGLDLPTVTQFTVPYYLELADGIYSFAIAFPVTLYLVYLSNYRMITSQLRNRLFIRPENISMATIKRQNSLTLDKQQ